MSKNIIDPAEKDEVVDPKTPEGYAIIQKRRGYKDEIRSSFIDWAMRAATAEAD